MTLNDADAGIGMGFNITAISRRTVLRWPRDAKICTAFVEKNKLKQAGPNSKQLLLHAACNDNDLSILMITLMPKLSTAAI